MCSWVHHCGKDAARGAGGHSSLRAATDVELEITRSGEDEAGSASRLEPWEAEGGPLPEGADGANRP